MPNYNFLSDYPFKLSTIKYYPRPGKHGLTPRMQNVWCMAPKLLTWSFRKTFLAEASTK